MERRLPSLPVLGLLLATLALAFALRLVRLADANVWWDEGLAVWAARQSPAAIARWTAADVHPPLYFWLLHGWRLLVGDAPFAARFLSVAAGTLTVAAVWRLGRVLWPGRHGVALAGALLVALSRFGLWWSQEARMYALGALLATLSLGFAVSLRWRWQRAAVAGYLATTLAALWTLYLLAFLLVIEGLYWLWTLRHLPTWRARGRMAARWAALQAIVLLAFAPWLAYALPLMRSWSVQVDFDPLAYGSLYATLLSLGISTEVERFRPIVLALGSLVGAGLLATRARRTRDDTPPRDALALLGLALLVPPLVVWGVTMVPRSFGYLPKPEARYLLPFAPSFGLLLAQAIAGLARGAGRAWQLIAAAGLAALLFVSLASVGDFLRARYVADEYQSVALTLRAHAQPGDGVVLHTDDSWPVFAYHWSGPWRGTPHLQDADAGGADFFLAPLWQAHEALWLVVNEDALRADPQRHFEGWLSDRAAAQHEWRFGPRRLLLFARAPHRAAHLLALAPGLEPPSPALPLTNGGLALVGWEQPLSRARAGERVHLAAYVARDGAGGTLEIGLEGLPESRVAVAVPPGTGVARLTVSVLVPPAAPAGATRWTARLGESEATLGDLQVVRRAISPTSPLPPPAWTADASFGEPPIARLVGYDLAGTDGASLRVTLRWQVAQTAPLSYKVFVHLVNGEGQVIAQRDDFPMQGQRPTPSWLPGETLADPYDIPLEAVPPGTYRLAVGLYDPATGTRLGPVHDNAGAVQPNDQAIAGAVTLPLE